MQRGSTPTVTIKFKDTTIRSDASYYITLKNNNYELTKSPSNIDQIENYIETKLTQEETLNFDDSYPLYIQVRICEKDGTIWGTQVVKARVNKILYNEVIG